MKRFNNNLAIFSVASVLALPGWLCSPPAPSTDAGLPPARDAALQDSGPADREAVDASTLDSVQVDTTSPDSAISDSAIADSAIADSTMPDSTMADSAVAPSVGRFTGENLTCGDYSALLTASRASIVDQFDPVWFTNYNDFINNYEDDEGPNPDAGRRAVAMAALLDDNVYPYCIPVLDLAEAHPQDPMALNDAAVCLIYLQDWAGSGRLLDCAYSIAPELHVTLETGAVWYDRQAQIDEAIAAKVEACSKAPESSHCNQNGEAYAQQNGRDAAAAAFHSGIASNYPWDNGDGTSGGGAPERTGICCNCTDKIYDDVMVCVDECTASMGCFTGICTPDTACCGDNSPFSLGIQICVPPTSPVQACIGADSSGNLDISVQGTLANVVTVGVRGRISFGGSGAPSTSVGVYSGGTLGGAGAGVDLDLPSGKVSKSVGVSFGGIGFTLGLPDANGWAHIAQCL